MASTMTDTKASIKLGSSLSVAVDLGSASHRFAWERALSYIEGAGAGAANLLFTDKDQIAASGTKDWDLSGSLTDALKEAVVFARVKLLAVYAWSSNTNNVVIGNAAATQWQGPFGAVTHTIAVQPGGIFMIGTPSATGWAVGAGATDLLRITNSGAGTVVDYEIAILGAAS